MSILSPREIIQTNSEVFSLPKIFIELQSALKDPEKTFQDFGWIISCDPGLSARLLKIVNSSFYGFERNVETISHAISIIGMEQLSDLILSTLVINQFKGIPSSIYNMQKFWRHSITCGLAAKTIAKFCNDLHGERYYLGGILHDIGILVFLKLEPDLSRQCLDMSKRENECIYLSEKKILGFDHSDMSAELLKNWEMPARLIEMVSGHHQTAKSNNFQIESSVLHLAEFITDEMNNGFDAEFATTELEKNCLEKLRINPKDLESISVQVDMQLKSVMNMFF